MPVKAVQQFMLGTVTGSEKQARGTLRAMKEAGYEGIELCGFMIHPSGWTVRLLTRAAGMPVGRGGGLPWRELVAEEGLYTVGLHMDLGSLERDPASAAEEAERLGTEFIVITGMYRYDYGSGEAVKGLAERLNRAGEALAAQGRQLLYHNHNCELRRIEDGRKAYDVLMEDTDPKYVNFEFDSYWISEGGADALSLMRRLGSRMKLWHINDRGTRLSGPAMTPILKTDSVELGYGNMELEPMARQAEAAGVKAVILESHRNWIGGSPVKSFQASAGFMNRYF